MRRFSRAVLTSLVGSAGISGARLAEAAEADMMALRDLIQGGLKKLFELAGDEDPWPWVVALYPDSVVVDRDGKLWRYPYTVAGTDVSFGTPVEVVRTFVPADTDRPDPAAAPASPAATGAALIEAVGEDEQPSRFRVRVVRAGLSRNGNFYPDAVLREAAPLFEGVRVFVKSDREHLAQGGKDVRNLIGGLSQPVFVEGAGPDQGEIQAVLTLIVGPDDPTAVRLREAVSKGLSHLFGLSIDVSGQAKPGPNGTRIAEAFTQIHSVDLIVEPGAGGQVISFVEAAGAEGAIMTREQIIALIQSKRPDLLEGKDFAQITDTELQEILASALAAGAVQQSATTEPAANANLTEAVETRIRMRELINGSRLPDRAKIRLIGEFSARAKFTEADVTSRIKEEAEYLAQIGAGGGHVAGLGDAPFIEAGEDQAQKFERMLDAFFDPTHKDHRHAQSFKECYVQITGDTRVTGQIKHCTRLTEALDTGSFANVLGDGIHRRMIAEYRSATDLDIWKLLTGTPVPVSDFRTQERTRFGGYGDLPTVAEKGAYNALTSPGDEKAEYAVAKRGGLETVTLEMIRNDDVGAIRRIPVKLARAAKRTLCKFVLDFIKDNPEIYDGKALFHVDHANLSTAALSASAYAAARLAMVKQPEAGSGEALGVGPKYLWVPADLEEQAHDLFRRGTNNDKTFVQSLLPTIVPVWYWTDADDWAVSADPLDIPTIEIGFLDGNEEPELFVQDSPTAGSVFTNDQVTYKIRHVYGGTVVDYRGLHKSVVVAEEGEEV